MRFLKILTLVALMTCLATPGLAQDMFEREVELEKNAVIAAKLAQQTVQGDYKLVTGPELKKWMDDGKDVLIIDTMPFESSYAKGHVPTAKQFLFPIPDMPAWDKTETDGKSKDDYLALLGPDKNRTIVIYCGFTKCTRSHNGAMWARQLGYTDVYRFPGGIYAWRGLDYPVEQQ